MATSEEVTVREYQPGDREGFSRLHDEIFDQFDEPVEYFDWIYDECPFSESPQLTVAERRGRVVGTMGFVPTPIETGRRVVSGRQPADIMIAEGVRSYDLFRRMAKFSDRFLDVEGLVVGFPRGNTVPLWKRIRDAAVSFRRPKQFVVAESIRNAKSHERDDLEVSVVDGPENPSAYTRRVDHQFDETWIGPDRTEAYYAWRLEKPETTYKLFVASRSGAVHGYLLTGHDRTRNVLSVEEAVLEREREPAVFDRLLGEVVDHYDGREVLHVSPDCPLENSAFGVVPGNQMRDVDGLDADREAPDDPYVHVIVEPSGGESLPTPLAAGTPLKFPLLLCDNF